MRLRGTISDRQLHALVKRLLGSHQSKTHTPVIISAGRPRHNRTISIGRVISRTGGRVCAVVDTALVTGSAITVFLPDNAYLGEVLSCVPDGSKHAVELLLIQYKRK